MSIVIIRNGRAISDRKNLSGVLRHARNVGAVLRQSDTWLFVQFGDNAACATQFASPVVLSQWINARVKFGRGNFKKAD